MAEKTKAVDEDRPFVEPLNEWLANQPDMDQSKLARAIGVPQTYVNRWMRGVYSPQLSDLAAIERAMGLRKGYFLVKADFAEPFDKSPGVPDAINDDRNLTAAFKRLLLRSYEAAVEESKASRKTPR